MTTVAMSATALSSVDKNGSLFDGISWFFGFSEKKPEDEGIGFSLPSGDEPAPTGQIDLSSFADLGLSGAVAALVVDAYRFLRTEAAIGDGMSAAKKPVAVPYSETETGSPETLFRKAEAFCCAKVAGAKQSARNLYFAVTHPVTTAKAIGENIKKEPVTFALGVVSGIAAKSVLTAAVALPTIGTTIAAVAAASPILATMATGAALAVGARFVTNVVKELSRTRGRASWKQVLRAGCSGLVLSATIGAATGGLAHAISGLNIGEHLGISAAHAADAPAPATAAQAAPAAPVATTPLPPTAKFDTLGPWYDLQGHGPSADDLLKTEIEHLRHLGAMISSLAEPEALQHYLAYNDYDVGVSELVQNGVATPKEVLHYLTNLAQGANEAAAHGAEGAAAIRDHALQASHQLIADHPELAHTHLGRVAEEGYRVYGGADSGAAAHTATTTTDQGFKPHTPQPRPSHAVTHPHHNAHHSGHRAGGMSAAELKRAAAEAHTAALNTQQEMRNITAGAKASQAEMDLTALAIDQSIAADNFDRMGLTNVGDHMRAQAATNRALAYQATHPSGPPSQGCHADAPGRVTRYPNGGVIDRGCIP